MPGQDNSEEDQGVALGGRWIYKMSIPDILNIQITNQMAIAATRR